MPQDFHDINDPGGFSTETLDEPFTQDSAANEPAEDRKEKEPELRFVSAQFEPHPVNGYAVNKECVVTGTAKLLRDDAGTKCSLKLYTVYEGAEEDLQINPSKNGTTSIDRKTGEFKFEAVPLYIPSDYPDRDDFKAKIRYKGIISAETAEKPLEIFLDLPDENSSPVDLKKGHYDDEGEKVDAKQYPKGGEDYLEGTPVHELQKILEEFRYLPAKSANGVFCGKTEDAVKNFQSDSGEKLRVNKSGGKLVEAQSVTYSGAVDGIVNAAVRDEIAVWRRENYLRPIPNLYHEDYDKEAANKDIKPDPRGYSNDATSIVLVQLEDVHLAQAIITSAIKYYSIT